MDINEATRSYESWLKGQLAGHGGLDTTALKGKHEAMKSNGPHAFLRATFYRWVQLWPDRGMDAPKVLSVGDAHVENFGTWRDAEGRLVWGTNDFDEVCELPYTSDLVRLGVSVRLVVKELDDFSTSATHACELVLRGYTGAIEAKSPTPFVLSEENAHLRALAMRTFLAVPPGNFWKKRLKKTQHAGAVPASVAKLLESSLPRGSRDIEFREPIPADPPGLGSRGKRRFYAFAIWHGARVLREAKPVVPSAWNWASRSSAGPRLEELVQSPRRCPDPTQQLQDGWIVRRLAPDAIKIELDDLVGDRATQEEEEALLESMGAELGRLHAGPAQRNLIARDLSRRLDEDKEWYDSAVRAWTKMVQEDLETFGG